VPAAKKAAAKPAEELTVEDPKDMQFPSEAGEPELEISKRSADNLDEESETHRKVFTVPPGTQLTDELHNANVWAMRQYLMNQGLRPAEDGGFVGAEDNADGVSLDLVYECQVVPAHVATDPEVSHATVPPAGETTTSED